MVDFPYYGKRVGNGMEERETQKLARVDIAQGSVRQNKGEEESARLLRNIWSGNKW